MPQVAPSPKADHSGVALEGMSTPWVNLLESIQRRRWPGALYYKPACLLAVIDGIEDGSLDPSNLNPQVVLARFHALVVKIAPARAEFGWRPFWHLGNDGAWGFFQGVRRVIPEDYGKERKPNSRGELLNRIDRVSVEPSLQAAWRSPHTRAILRHGLIAMLRKDGDSACSTLADICGVEEKMAETSVHAFIASEAQSRGRQGFLESADARRAVERRAMDVASAHFRNEGYIVDDVSLRMPYDLQCTKGAEVLFVEVKGTTSDGSVVLLTAGEVRFASTHANQMVLAVVSDVALDAEASLIASGGVLRLFWRWKPEADDLSALSYSCRVPLHIGQEPGESPRIAARDQGMDTNEAAFPSVIQEL
jgi:hypothetical protein